ncbi:DUF7266 family protein [Haloparvum sp. PAK95]|uniref:DUF7266 family protein n=1 Tax=Haloparvum sp. PAK95 TaxID=3418962 RepID=UPI003D2EEB32
MRNDRTISTDGDRAVSTTLSYVLTLSITALLASGLILAAGSTVESRQQSVVDEELKVIGQQFASKMLAADRLATNGGETVRVELTAPSQVAGSSYRVTVSDGDPATLRLEARNVDVDVTVTVPVDTPVVDTSFRGGNARIVLTDGELEVRSA